MNVFLAYEDKDKKDCSKETTLSYRSGIRESQLPLGSRRPSDDVTDAVSIYKGLRLVRSLKTKMLTSQASKNKPIETTTNSMSLRKVH